jgi:Cof subfamily protein (haloacid dehalogenase superfamily)
MIKLIAVDLDGTLLTDKGEMHQRFKNIIPDLNDSNIIFAAASGRLYGTLKRNFQHIKSKILFICHNGALIEFNDESEPIFESIMNPNIVLEVLYFLQELGVEIYLCSKEHAFLHNPSKEISRKFVDCDVKVKEVDALSRVSESIYRIGVFQPDGIRPEVIEKVKNRFGNILGCHLGGEIWLDIINKDIDKGTAIKLIQKKFNISAEETMVFGDYCNDLPMFSTARYSYAMANAPGYIKNAANFEAPSNNDHGVMHIILKEILEGI